MKNKTNGFHLRILELHFKETLRTNFLGRESAPGNATKSRCNAQSSWISAGFSRREGNSPRGTIDPGKSVSRATRWLRALLRAVYRNNGDTHGAVTSGSCPRRQGLFDAVVGTSHGSSRRGCRAPPIQITNGTRVYSIVTSRSVISICSIDRGNVHSERRQKASWRTNRHSINRSFAIAIARFTS